MSHHTLHEKRILAIDPVSRGFGYAVLEGPRLLIDWSVIRVADDKHRGCLRRIDALIDQYLPDVVVTENLSRGYSRRSLRICRLVDAIAELAQSRSIDSRSFSRSQVHRAFFDSGVPTKREVAIEIALRFPELRPKLPNPRKPWMSEDDRMSIFGSVALVLTYFAPDTLLLKSNVLDQSGKPIK